jgi:toxin YhaV
MDVNSWLSLYFTAFQERLNNLEQAVRRIRQARPEQFAKHPTVKLLKAVVQAILREVPMKPANPLFEQYNLSERPCHWRRVKRRMPPRYRLFFQFSSLQSQIVFAWLNDESSLRQAGAKTDVYRVFKRLLDQGKVPDS